MDEFQINDKVTIVGKNCIGTIAFIGNTHFSDGLWLGIIFDQPVGRNNGSYEGIRYFKCGKNHGTFVRPCQVRKISFVPPESEVPKKNCRKHYPNYLRDDCLSKPNEKHNSYTKKNTLLKKIREDITPKSTSMPFILSEIDAKLNHGEESEALSGTLANFPENIFSRREKEGRNDLCFGVILDEPKGRNNGSFEGVRYFKCTRNHGIFVRACQLRRVSQHEIKIVKTEDKIKNVMRYPNYLKTKNSLRLQEDKRKQKNAALTTRKMNSDTQLCPLKPKIQLKKESNCKKETVLKKESSLLNTEPTKNVVIQAKHSLSLNSKICYFQELESQTLDNEVEAEAAKMKHRIKKLETELKYARKVIEKNKTDKETLEEQLDYYQKHAYALQKKINKLNRDLTESDRKTKALEQKMEQLHQITEISIIEKEMAEHKIEQMEADLQELTTTCQILQTELSIKEEEMEIQCENKVPTVHYMKQLDYKNKILYNALLQLRKLYILKHQNLLEAEETIKNNMSALKDLAISQENLQNVIYVLNQDVSDMHETIDGLTEADELVCEVTERSLILEHKMGALVETLKIMEESIEVSNEIEEILQESYLEREKEIEAMEQKVYQTEKSLLKTTNLVNDYKEELEKYRHLVYDLRMRNDLLELKVQTVTQERKLAVMEAENLKLQFHRENKMTLQHLVKDDNLDIENQTFQQQVKYLEMYLPENFFGRNEHLALQDYAIFTKLLSYREPVPYNTNF
ncbi:dynactin subunit 1-like [Argiope bruennichi]|uniref:dynactin subunit 1-like n=1 Tax=Argiope bruennichi TaxID=94029 RepID=UPI0024948302|nr:dynactin subunit 1-like [Argiope bruennichi]